MFNLYEFGQKYPYYNDDTFFCYYFPYIFEFLLSKFGIDIFDSLDTMSFSAT